MVRGKLNRIPLLVAIIFVLTLVGVVTSDCILGIHGFDLAVSFSRYIGSRHSTSMVYLLLVILMLPLMVFYVIKEKLPVIKRISYYFVYICILGTASFPFSPGINDWSTNIHKYFAIGLMLSTGVLFVVCLIFARTRKAKTVSFLSIIYALLFIVMYYLQAPAFRATFFIWEVSFILLLMVIMDTEHA